MKKILLIGGTGAMGVYLAPLLVDMGYQVDVLSLDEVASTHPALRYIQGDGMDMAFMQELLKNNYDGIVDFLIYKTEAFRARYQMLLEATRHYIFLSSYRVYAGESPVTEDSPQLLDVSDNEQYLATEDYSLIKARGEDILEASGYKNWTVVRPAITYSKLRYQLVTLEANVVITRARKGKTVVLPQSARHVQATMTWAGDVAQMLARLLLNEKALCRHYTLATAEHQSWETIAGYYEELAGLKVIWVDDDDYVRIVASSPDKFLPYKWQLEYDRLFERVIDNSRVLADTGLMQSEITSLYDGLRRELEQLPADAAWTDASDINGRMDAYLMQIEQ